MKKYHIFALRGLVREQRHWGSVTQGIQQAFPASQLHFLELPGNGFRFQEKSPNKISEMVEVLRGYFLQVKKNDDQNRKPVLLAISLGGMVAIEWMNRYPFDFACAVLGNSSLKTYSPFYQRLRPGNYPGILKALLSKDLRQREEIIVSIVSNRAKNDSVFFNQTVSQWYQLQKEYPVSRSNFLRQLSAAMTFSPPKSAPKTPILFLNSAKDRLVNPACSEILSQSWKLELRTHPEAGHDLGLDAPEWLIEQMMDWYSRHSQG